MQQVLKEIASSKALINTKKINKDIRLISQRKSNILYSLKEEFEHNREFKTQLQEIIDTLKRMLNNDTIKERNIFKENLEERDEQNQIKQP